MEEIGDTQGALSFSDSWQRKVLVASQYTYIESDNVYDNHVEQDWFFLQMDNTSNRCMTFPAESCSCEPRILLKWARILFYKVARTYVAKPLLLAFLPLCIGVLVGIWIGKNSQTKQQQQQDDSSSSIQGSTLSFRIIHTLCKWLVPQENLQRKENRVRTHLKSDVDTKRESGVDIQDIPKHVAVIMDGNRRYGKARYGNVAKVRPALCVLSVYFVSCFRCPCTILYYTIGPLGWKQDAGRFCKVVYSGRHSGTDGLCIFDGKLESRAFRSCFPHANLCKVL